MCKHFLWVTRLRVWKSRKEKGKKMKVLLVTGTQCDEPLGVLILSSLLKSNGHEVEGAMSKQEDVDAIVERFKPDLIAYSVITGEEKELLALNKKLKEKHRFVSLWGGPHVTFSPEIIEEKGVDIVCIGEGEYSMTELIGKLEKKEPIDQTQNLWVKKDGKVIRNPLGLLNENLDNLPFADRELFKRFKKDSQFSMMAIRGCPYNCAYCFNHIFNKMYKGKGKIVRQRSVDNVLKEIREIESKHKVSLFQFHDDTFILDRRWFKEFCEKYPNATDKPFICNVRCNLVDKEIADLLKSANCKVVYVGIEAGNEKIRNKLLKRNVSKEQMVNCTTLLNERGIKIFTQNIIGLPTSTIENDFETLYLNVECKPFFAWVSIFTPYPKTELAEIAKKVGFDELPETYHKETVLKLPHAQQVNNLHKLFSIGVEFPKAMPRIKEIVWEVKDQESYERLRKIFLDFRKYKQISLENENTLLPKSVKEFLKECEVEA
jgi:anaerobic magnesium-protoporphyrin IX monomethyl ester cyclase